MSFKNNNQIHINIYSEIVKGKYNPCQKRNNETEVLKNLVYESNSKGIFTLNATDNPTDYIENTDFLAFGYKKKKDYKIQTVPKENGTCEILISPLKIYELKEVMDIPLFETFKTKCYLDFMGDEFERIKIKAEWVLENSESSKITETYALKHIQKAKKMFYESKQVLNEIQKTGNPEDTYILFVLNLFIIRTILFYQKMFKPYLTSQPNTEEQLLHEVIQELSLRKLCKLFPCEKSVICEYLKKSRSENIGNSGICYNEKAVIKDELAVVDEPKNEYQPIINNNSLEEAVNNSKTFSHSKSQHVVTDVKKYDKIKLNGQINVLVDVFIQMMEEIEVPEGKFIETSRQNLKDFIVANFVDKNDKALSPFTVDTILKPYRTDKHIKKESPRKIDLSKKIKKK